MKTMWEFDELEWGSGSANDRAMRGIFNQARRKAEEEGTVESRVDEGALDANSLADYLKTTEFSVDPAERDG